MKYTYGNHCGHVPEEPRLYIRPAYKKKTYDILTDAQDNLSKYYDEPKKWLTNIDETRFNGETGNRMGQQRTESREAVAAVAGVILDHLDLDTMNVVKYKKGKPFDMSIYDIAEKSNLNYERCWRALMVLQNGSYVTSHQEKVKVVALKRVSLQLLYDLGISGLRVHRCRGKKHKALEMQRGEAAINNMPKLKKVMNDLKKTITQQHLTESELQENKEKAAIERQRKKFCDMHVEIMRELEKQGVNCAKAHKQATRTLYEQGVTYPGKTLEELT